MVERWLTAPLGAECQVCSSFNLSLLLHAELETSVWHEEANLNLTHLVSRLAKMPRRHQLRGPFGQMLMEEMAKSDLKQQVAVLSFGDSIIEGEMLSGAGRRRKS